MIHALGDAMSAPSPPSPFDSIRPAPRDADDPLIGVTLADRYVVQRLIGVGGMARVYYAQHRAIGRPLAIKVLKKELAKDATLVRRFTNEGRTVGSLGHPNIVESLDMGSTPDGSPYLVLEFLDGTPLSHRLDRTGMLSVGRAAYIAAQIARAVAAAHERGIIHRDLKPENVFLIRRNGVEDHVKVLDFGVSKFVGSDGTTSDVTAAGTVVGTPQYMAPEQIGGESVDERTDVYGLGIILYEMLVGIAPFNGRSMQDTLHAVFAEVPAPVDSIRREVPAALASLIASALQKKREQRPPTMLAMAEALDAFAEAPTPTAAGATRALAPSAGATSRPVLARPRVPSGSETLSASMDFRAPASAPPASTPASASPSPPPARRRAIVGLVAGACAILAGLGVARQRMPAKSVAVVASDIEPPAASIRVEVQASAPSASAIFAGRSVALPALLTVPSSHAPMLITVSAPGHQTRVYRVAADRDFALISTLPAGEGAREASREETAIALGNAGPPAVASSTASVASTSTAPPSVIAPPQRPRPIVASSAPAPIAPPTSPSSTALPLPILTDR